jgi:hypothetical protein
VTFVAKGEVQGCGKIPLETEIVLARAAIASINFFDSLEIEETNFIRKLFHRDLCALGYHPYSFSNNTIFCDKMPKASAGKRNGAGKSSPYAPAAASKNNVFKFNTDLGQHILKNPGVAQAIVDKADLKQSDVSVCPLSSACYLS